MERLMQWLRSVLGTGPRAMTEREAQEALRVPRKLTGVEEVYPRGERPSWDRD